MLYKRGKNKYFFIFNFISKKNIYFNHLLILLLIFFQQTIFALAQTAPELPRVFINTTFTSPTGRTINVAAGGNFQQALNDAQPGDTITLEAGAAFTGPFTLPNKSGNEWVIIRSSTADANLPPAGIRVNPSYANVMPKIIAPSGNSALITANGAHHFRFIGIEFKPAGNTFIFNMIILGSALETNEANLPHNITFDRAYVHGDPVKGGRRGIAMQSRATAVIDSYISDFKEVGADTQALISWNGPGPFKIVNNYLEAAGENIMFGGSTAGITDLVPSDIEIRRNHFSKPLSWRDGDPAYAGTRWTVKNLLEFKNGRRALVEGNVFENNWGGQGQNGWFLVLTPRSESGLMPWATVEDVTFRNNIVRNSTKGITILGRDNTGPSGNVKRISVTNNVFELGAFPLPGSGTFLGMNAGQTVDVSVGHNTVLHTGSIISADLNIYGSMGPGEGAPNIGFAFRNNIISVNTYGIVLSGKGGGNTALNYGFPDAIVEKNAIAGPWPSPGGATISNYPENNFYPQSLDEAKFIERANGNYLLSASSPYKNAGTDGKDIGADIEAVEKATAGVLDGMPQDISPPIDNKNPIITNVSPSQITQNSVVISWTTDESSTRQVEYGPTIAYGQQTIENTSLMTSHSGTLNGLLPNTLYHYRAKSKDAAGNLAVSDDFTFNTTAAQPTLTPNLGDINGDKKVDILDILEIAKDFGKTSGFNPKVDIAPPFGSIDIFDIMGVVRNWGKQY